MRYLLSVIVDPGQRAIVFCDDDPHAVDRQFAESSDHPEIRDGETNILLAYGGIQLDGSPHWHRSAQWRELIGASVGQMFGEEFGPPWTDENVQAAVERVWAEARQWGYDRGYQDGLHTTAPHDMKAILFYTTH